MQAKTNLLVVEVEKTASGDLTGSPQAIWEKEFHLPNDGRQLLPEAGAERTM